MNDKPFSNIDISLSDNFLSDTLYTVVLVSTFDLPMFGITSASGSWLPLFISTSQSFCCGCCQCKCENNLSAFPFFITFLGLIQACTFSFSIHLPFLIRGTKCSCWSRNVIGSPSPLLPLKSCFCTLPSITLNT